jgi:hypothetical protein
LEAADWIAVNAAAVAWTSAGAAADFVAAGTVGARAEGTTLTALTATEGVTLCETGCAKGTAEGAEREGVNDNDGMARFVPKNGVAAGEVPKLAPAAPDIPAEGTVI